VDTSIAKILRNEKSELQMKQCYCYVGDNNFGCGR